MAESIDGGESFARVSETPVMDRSDEGIYIRGIHSIRRRKGGDYECWYSAGNSWTNIEERTTLITIHATAQLIVLQVSEDWKNSIKTQRNSIQTRKSELTTIRGIDYLFYTAGGIDGSYILGVAKE